jgi:hypothetical protein
MRTLLLPLLIGAGALGACGDAAPGTPGFGSTPLASAQGQRLSVAVFTAPQPPERGEVMGRLVFTDPAGAMTDGVAVTVTPWMPEHGHGTSVMPTVEPDGAGGFLISNLYLAMPGTWQLRVNVSGAVTDELVPSFDIP